MPKTKAVKTVRMARLTPEEKEVVIQYDKASDKATVWCADSTEINKLRRKGLKELETTRFGSKFEIDKKYITIRKPPKLKNSRVPKTSSRKKSEPDNPAVLPKVQQRKVSNRKQNKLGGMDGSKKSNPE